MKYKLFFLMKLVTLFLLCYSNLPPAIAMNCTEASYGADTETETEGVETDPITFERLKDPYYINNDVRRKYNKKTIDDYFFNTNGPNRLTDPFTRLIITEIRNYNTGELYQTIPSINELFDAYEYERIANSGMLGGNDRVQSAQGEMQRISGLITDSYPVKKMNDSSVRWNNIEFRIPPKYKEFNISEVALRKRGNEVNAKLVLEGYRINWWHIRQPKTIILKPDGSYRYFTKRQRFPIRITAL